MQVLVNIDEIEARGDLAKAWDVTREQVDEMVSGDKAGYRATAPVHIEARFTKVDRRVMVEARSQVELTCPCGRCLAPAQIGFPVEFELTLVPLDEYEDDSRKAHDAGQSPVAGSFESEQADEETYQGKTIDFDPIYREQLLLALPGYPVCREACKGLCPVCGNNLNERDCGCDPHVPDPRWAGLKKLKLQ